MMKPEKKRLSEKETIELLQDCIKNIEKISKAFHDLFDKADQAACEKYGITMEEWKRFKEIRLKRKKDLMAMGYSFIEASRIVETMKP